jgi:ABC-type transport system involved in cytochrome bd biosynthesis fused ATPase/permease subunit
VRPKKKKDDSAVPLTTAPRIEFRAVSAEAAGQTILNGVSFSVEPGSHVAIVGSSGAGKSSLVGILLGWLRLSGGEVLINGVPLNAHALRRSVAWVDPSVQVWNRSLYSNLLYGSEATGAELSNVLDSAMLRSLLEGLPEGLQTKLGESGGLVSGGEGQRVRLGRAMLHPQPKLVILDEPFRGLDREKRLELLARARRHWAGCTLLCITHDLADTLDFDRVLVVERGQVVQQGAPVQIAADESSRYAELLAAEDRARAQVWDGDFWRRIGIHSGHVVEHMPKPLESKRPETIVA